MSDSLQPLGLLLGFPVLQYLPEFAQTHVHWVNNAIQLFHPLSPPSPPALNVSSIRSLPMSQLFSSHGHSIGVSAWASVLPTNIQGWFLLGLTGFISLQSKGLSRVFSNTTIWKHQFFLMLNLLYGPTLTSVCDYWKNHSFDSRDLYWESDVSAFWYAA